MMNRLHLGISLLIVIVTGLLPDQGEALQSRQLALTQYSLSSSIIGRGSLNNLNQPPAFTCSSPSTSCSGTFAAGTNFTLHASPATGYAFSGWSGCGSVTSQGDCNVALSADSSLAATFSLTPLVQITGDQTPYQSLQQACNAANPDARILARNVSLSDSSLTINRGINLFLKGGLEADFSTINGESSLPGKLTIRSGSLRVERLVIAGASSTPKALISLAVTPALPSITAGATRQFSATGLFSDNTKQDLTGSVFWGTSDASIATISNAAGSNGMASAVAAGSATVIAVSGSVSDQTTLTVKPALVSLTITPANAIIAHGASQQFSASGTFSNGSIQDLTSQATWTSSGVVQMSATGLASTTTSGLAATATITATLGAISGSTNLGVTTGSAAGANVMAITVNGSLCSAATSGGYFNKPCVSVTVCNPNSSTCQTVNDILLDTGSYGLRIFKSAIPGLALTQVASGTGALAECVQFADGSSLWGPVQLASVQLGGEPAVQVPIQVVDATYGSVPPSCGTPDADPAAAGFTGILGVGPFPQDCGSGCVNSARNGMYYGCIGSNCSATAVSLGSQVQNPVASLPLDNNGLMVQLPAAPLGGEPSADGVLILGIGTGANNMPASPAVLPTDQSGDFRAVFQGSNSSSFLDTGSNGLFFPGALTTCASPDSFWYCPSATSMLSATTIGAPGSPSVSVSFYLGNFSRLTSSNNEVFSEIGGPSGFGFDWGLPFFLGRSVFFGIDATTSPLGTGPLVAF
jgi:hypothetical protein